jgi:hypothetical protein
MNINFNTGGNAANLGSLVTLDYSYNLNEAAWDSTIFLTFNEGIVTNQGPAAWTRVGLGARYYPTGFNSQRVIFDNKVEGRYWRPAPFVGASAGFSSFSITNVGGTVGYFNAANVDVDIRAGAEVVLTTNMFLTGQWSFLLGMPTVNEKTQKDLSYSGLGLYLGLKISTF